MIPALGYLFLSTADRRANAWLFTWSAYNDYNSGVPQPRYLPTPTHLNALDAMARNTAVIGFHQRALPRRPHLTLQHAQAQPPQTIIHHPWIDLILIPRFRDSVLLATDAGMLDEDKFCAGMLSLDDCRGKDAALVVRAGSWDSRGSGHLVLSFKNMDGWRRNVTSLLGDEQMAWLERGDENSRSTT
ncbi:uncharacterized protein B0J16DRAFT_376730 [Fusarium flagelliforme]|uniref:uncharacterized protein n=1 Tax=Fusarium flagelliforme TaxID=2675880 RepID=UPI001E8DB8CD|nr:uncharacterized protein B0J16DRAFT_376730 [Fusarium flagelliforme]KAH7169656.1 hypothetical protein B0J16DRAFT_376730 [Fusarium flagelliforme]